MSEVESAVNEFIAKDVWPVDELVGYDEWIPFLETLAAMSTRGKRIDWLWLAVVLSASAAIVITIAGLILRLSGHK